LTRIFGKIGQTWGVPGVGTTNAPESPVDIGNEVPHESGTSVNTICLSDSKIEEKKKVGIIEFQNEN